MTVEELYRKTKYELQKAGIDDPAFNALCLIEKVFGYNRTDLIIKGEKQAEKDKTDLLNSYIARRCSYEPLQYILGKWEFMGYDFFVGKGVLIPREDTCEVVNLCIDQLKSTKNPKILDLCAGSGAIGIVLSKALPNANVTLIEKSNDAFPYLLKNIKENKADVTAIKGDIFSCINDYENNEFDLIVSNPPYIKRDELPTLQQEVQKEPALALDGGIDGYDFYKFIVSFWSKKLKNGGHMAFELGENQYETVKTFMENQKFTNFAQKTDLGNVQRAIIGTLIRK